MESERKVPDLSASLPARCFCGSKLKWEAITVTRDVGPDDHPVEFLECVHARCSGCGLHLELDVEDEGPE